MTRPRLLRIGRQVAKCRRSIHHVPMLSQGKDFRDGIQELLSARAFDIAFTQYQAFVVSQLNRLTAGTSWENSTTKQILIQHARTPDTAPTFNYASMAHNNHFFFECLSPVKTKPSTDLEKSLVKTFGSLDTLRREFVVHADAMFGPGFVWLVKHNIGDRAFSIMNTYLAGTPYPSAHGRRQEVDMNTQTAGVNTRAEHWRRFSGSVGPNPPGAFGKRSTKTVTALGGLELEPVLCLNTWEHVWLHDYQIAQGGISGKRLFLENWWRAIDWQMVEQKVGRAVGSQTRRLKY